MKNAILVVLLLGITQSATSQSQRDAALRVAFSVEKKINKRFSLALMNRSTFNQNFTELGAIMFDLGMSCKLNSFLELSGNYRFLLSRNPDNFYQEAHRFYGDLSISKDLKDFSLQFRTRLQRQQYGWDFHDPYKAAKNFMRNKLTLRYKINSNYGTYVFAEQFYRLNNATEVQQYRFGLGLTRKFNLKHRIDIYYMYQKEINVKAPAQDFISGINYTFRF